MVKFSQQFKVRVVKDYLSSSLGHGLIAHKYNVKGHLLAISWVHRYQAFGSSGLNVPAPKKVFDGSFKVDILK